MPGEVGIAGTRCRTRKGRLGKSGGTGSSLMFMSMRGSCSRPVGDKCLCRVGGSGDSRYPSRHCQGKRFGTEGFDLRYSYLEYCMLSFRPLAQN